MNIIIEIEGESTAFVTDARASKFDDMAGILRHVMDAPCFVEALRAIPKMHQFAPFNEPGASLHAAQASAAIVHCVLDVQRRTIAAHIRYPEYESDPMTGITRAVSPFGPWSVEPIVLSPRGSVVVPWLEFVGTWGGAQK